MKRKTNPNAIPLTQAIGGFELAAQARHLSEHTLADYRNTFRKFLAFTGDLPITDIDHHQIGAFLAAQTTVKKKTVLNYHTALSALWTWAVEEELVTENLLRRVHRPEPEINAIIPFTEDDIKAMFKVLQTTRPYSRPGKCTSVHTIPNHERNRAIIYLLLDTGMRATELCTARINQVDFKNRRITVFGKLSKERYLPFCARTGQAIWKYLAAERRNAPLNEPLFTTTQGEEMDRDRLLKQIHGIGRRAGVEDAHPHRFRHTFAITYLRNGGDPWSLQVMLGHSTMDMVRRYLAIAQADLDRVHRTASPVDNWRL